MRYVVYFRASVVGPFPQHTYRPHVLADIWHDWPAMRHAGLLPARNTPGADGAGAGAAPPAGDSTGRGSKWTEAELDEAAITAMTGARVPSEDDERAVLLQQEVTHLWTSHKHAEARCVARWPLHPGPTPPPGLMLYRWHVYLECSPFLRELAALRPNDCMLQWKAAQAHRQGAGKPEVTGVSRDEALRYSEQCVNPLVDVAVTDAVMAVTMCPVFPGVQIRPQDS